jgi:dienelactone hydrolase
MKKLLLILITIFITTNVYADHYKKKIDIKNFSPKQHCSPKKSLLVPAAKVFPGGEFIKFNSYSGFDQRAVIVGAHKKNPIEITSYLLMPKGSGKVPIVIWAHASGGADAYIFSEFINSGQKKLLDLGIGVMFIDNFCSRGVTSTWRDQSKATIASAAIDTMMAYKVLKNHPRSNGKIGLTGHSRGGTNALMVSDVKFTSLFLEGKNGFDAIIGEAAECRMAGLFLEPELTTNTKMLYVHGSIDNLTLAKPCEEHVKKIKAKPGQIKIDIKEGWHHDWHGGFKPKKVKAMTMHTCPAFRVDNEGNATGPIVDLGLKKYKLFPSQAEWIKATEDEPKKTMKLVFKMFKKEKCLKRGVTIGGMHGDEYLPQFINFFKENLL